MKGEDCALVDPTEPATLSLFPRLVVVDFLFGPLARPDIWLSGVGLSSGLGRAFRLFADAPLFVEPDVVGSIRGDMS